MGMVRRAGTGIRTPDLLITSETLCRLSYPGQDWGSLPSPPLLTGRRWPRPASDTLRPLPPPQTKRYVEVRNGPSV